MTATPPLIEGPLVGCDTLVALPRASADRVTLFAKNSDRPPREAQRIVQAAPARHARGTRVRCQHLDLPQVEETAGWIGAQPYWLWGLELGVNEHRVAIGNETVFAREPLGDCGLLGMDLVRLGLERARSAEEALTVITDLVQAHGQGGSGFAHVHWPYHNAFLIADPQAAWILETSDRHWAAREVVEVGNVSNGLAIDTGWARASADLESFASARGWWSPNAGRLDFAAVYGDESGVPPNLSRERRKRAAALLDAARGRLAAATLRTILRDHYDGGPIPIPRPVDDPRFFSLCMHADPLDNTTAAMVARLPAERAAPAAVWLCLGSPCVGAFLPCYAEGRVPAALSIAGPEPDPESPWWRMRELLSLVEEDFAGRMPRVRRIWDAFEEALAREADDVEGEAETRRREGRAEHAADLLTAFMRRSVDAYLARVGALVRELAGGG